MTSATTPSPLEGLEGRWRTELMDLGGPNTLVWPRRDGSEVVDLTRWAVERGYELRFIEQMPLDAQHSWERTEMITGHEILASLRAELDLELVSDALGDRPRREPARLRVSDRRAAEFERDLGQLGRLARPGLPRDDDDLVLAHRLGDVVLARDDRQFLVVVQVLRRDGCTQGGVRHDSQDIHGP